MPDRLATVALGRLTPGTSGDADGAPDGALVRCTNLRPAPAPDGRGFEYEAVGTPTPLLPGLSRVVWGALHSRQRPESYRESSDPDTRLEATDRLVLVVDPVAGLPQLQVFDLADALDKDATPLLTHGLSSGLGLDTGSRLSGALVPMGVHALVILSTQEAPGDAPVPRVALVVGDEDVTVLGSMPLPRARIAVATAATAGDPGASPGRYAVRACLEFPGGTFGPLGPASFRDVAPNPGGELHLFDVDVEASSVGALSDAWRDRAVGVAVFVSYVASGVGDRSPTDVEAATGPWRYARTVPIEDLASGEATIDDLVLEADALLAARAHEEGDLAYCGVTAATGLAFNQRAVLGGAALDYPVLAAELDSQGTGATDQLARVAIEVATLNGTLRRFGPVLDCHAGATFNIVGQTGGLDAVTYPDRRAKRVLVYRETSPGSEVWAEVATADLQAPDGSNLAGIFDKDGAARTLSVPVIAGGEMTVTETEIAEANARVDHDPNRVLAGDTGSLLAWPAARSQPVGDGPSDGVMALAVATQPASEGQFGDFPILALTRRGAWLIRTGTEIAGQEAFFLGTRPVATEGGAAGPGSATLMRGGGVAVFGASDDGLIPYDPFPRFDLTRDALGGSYGRFAPLFSDGPHLACHVGARGPEVWVCSPEDDGSPVVAYNVAADAFFVLDLDRVAWFDAIAPEATPERILVGIDGAGRLWREEGGKGNVDVLLETGPLAMGAPGDRKRLRRLRIHQRPALTAARVAMVERVERTSISDRPSDDDTLASGTFVSSLDGAVVRLHSGSVLRPRLVLTGQAQAGQRLQFIEVVYDPRGRSALSPGTRSG
ncbi:MAG: hypothetical protein AAFQ43_00260 [Bacteroidota bacterium]